MKTLSKSFFVVTFLISLVYIFYVANHSYIVSSHYTFSTLPYSLREPVFMKLLLLSGVILIIFWSVQKYYNLQALAKAQFFSLFCNSPSPMLILNNNKIVASNKAASNIYGYTKEELLTFAITDLLFHKFQFSHDITNINGYAGKRTVNMFKKKNGEEIMVEVSKGEIFYKNEYCLLFTVLNMAEIETAREDKRIAEEEKIKQEKQTTYLLENLPVDVAIFNKEHKYVFLNKTAVKDETMRTWMIGKDDFDYFKRKGTNMAIAELRRERFLKAIAGENEEWIDEHIVDGKEKFILRKFYPYYKNGVLEHVYGYGMDITEVKNAQKQRDEYINQLEKLAFATSHRLRQPICNLQGLLSIIPEALLNRADLKDIATAMNRSVTDMDTFTRDMAIKLHEYKQDLSGGEG